MLGNKLHQSAIVIDGLIISKWSRDVFEEMRAGGITAANCTCSVWEDFRQSMANIAAWKLWFRENQDILVQVYHTTDILRAKAEGKVGIILGWQNTAGIDNEIGFLSVFKELGVGVMQLTYNTQNLVGSGCLERHDSGLSDFGREVVAEMNRIGVLIDLSHVGPKTSADAIEFSEQRVCYSHCAPVALFNHPRNKTDEQLRFLADRGGFIGASTYPVFLPKGNDSTVDDCVSVIEYMINVAGEDCVGFGTDFTQGQDLAFFDWVAHDKGSARRILVRKDGLPKMPHGLDRLSSFGNLTAAMEERGWKEKRIRKVMGENWLKLLKDVWGA